MRVRIDSAWLTTAISIAAAAVALMYPDAAIALFLLAGLVLLLGIRVDGWHLRLGSTWRKRVHTWGPWILIVGGPLLGLLWLYVGSLSRINGDQTKFSWAWSPLASSEIEAMYVALRNQPPQAIQISCSRDTCTPLADGFYRLFEKLKWPQIRNAGVDRRYLVGSTGLLLNKTDSASQFIKNEIENKTGLKVHFHPMTPSQNVAHLLLVIGAKPPPDPLPKDLKDNLQILSEKLKNLATDLHDFASDRARDFSLLSPIDLNEPGAAKKGFERDVAFSNETKTRLNQRFSARMTYLLSELNILGIEMAFIIQDCNFPRVCGDWFGSIGDLLIQGRIVETRSMASDDQFWFNQLKP